MASLDDYRFLESFKRKRVKLATKDSAFFGVVQRISLNKTIVLEDVVEVKSGLKLLGAKLFFGYEILNVEFPSVTLKNNEELNCKLGQFSLAEFQPYRRMLMPEEDDQHVNYVVIDEFQEKFGPALMHIKKQQVIGVGADGVGLFQHERLCWLQIATKNNVYLFDILSLGGRAFKNGLSMILESNRILKVTHDCRCIAGCLLAQFGVNLINVFDTQVADVMHFYAETGGFLPERVSTLQEVVIFHLKMPMCHLTSLDIKTQLTIEDKEVWYLRPCPAPLLKVMALSVIHLLSLRLVLLDALMSDYVSLVDSYLTSSRDTPLHTQYIGKSWLELPKELRELLVIRQERREWAENHYPVTKDGRLRRYEVKPSSDTPDSQSLEHPGPQMTACHEPLLPEGESASPEMTPDHLSSARSSEDFTALGRGRPQDKESAVPALGRGFTKSALTEASREGLLPTESVLKTSSDAVLPDGFDSVCQPISIMAGVTKRGPCPPATLSWGRGLFSTPVSEASPPSLSFSSSGKLD